MKNWIKPALIALALFTMTYPLTAQAPGDAMAKPMDKTATKTYAGCVAAGTTAGTFTLTHATETVAMAKDSMAKDTMASDSNGKDSMAKDSASKTLALESKKVDLSKQVGHQVSVTGTEVPMAMAKTDTMAKSDSMTNALPVFSVASLKTIKATCGM